MPTEVTNDLVDTATTQVIDGYKTFNKDVTITTGGVTPLTIIGTVPFISYKATGIDTSQGVYSTYVTPRITFMDKNGIGLGDIGVYNPDNSNSSIRMIANLKNTQGTTLASSEIRAIVTKDANNNYITFGQSGYRPTPLYSSEILTLGNGVSLNTDQTITGYKTVSVPNSINGMIFTNQRVIFKNPDLAGITSTSGLQDSTTQYICFSTSESSVRVLGTMGYIQETNGDGRMLIRARRYSNTNSQELNVWSLASGGGYATAPFRAYADAVTTAGASDVLTKAHLESNITIGGNKTFTGNVSVTSPAPASSLVRNSTIAYTAPPDDAGSDGDIWIQANTYDDDVGGTSGGMVVCKGDAVSSDPVARTLTTVSTSDTEYSGYPYKYSFTATAATADRWASVVFQPADITTYLPLPICETADDKIYIWSKLALPSTLSIGYVMT